MMSDTDIIEVVAAHATGKKIQQRDADHPELGWRECPFPNWDFYRVDFRVTPEPRKPREWKICLDENGNALADSRFILTSYPKEVIRVREVLE